MRRGVTSRMLVLACLGLFGCADESGAARSSWDARPVATTPLAGEAAVARSRIAWAPDPAASAAPGGAVTPAEQPARGPLPIDGRGGAPSGREHLPTTPIAAPSQAPMCPSYGNEAAAILAAQHFPVESARISGGYQISNGEAFVSLWRDAPLIVLGLQGQPVYCAAERQNGGYSVPAGRRICFADSDGDDLFDRVYIVQAEPKSYDTGPVRYELNPIEAQRRASSECFIRG